MKQQRRPAVRQRVSPVQVILVIAVLAFAGWYVYENMFAGVSQYAVIETGTLGPSYNGDALIVRDEVPYDAEGVTSVDYIAQEGAVLRTGEKICDVYSSGYNQKEMMTLQDYRDQIKQKQQGLLQSETAYDQKMMRLETEVLERAKEVRLLVQGAKGNMVNQESILDTAITTRQNYLRQKYADDQSLTRLYDDESAQQLRIESWTKQYAASVEGVVSFYSDGYEYGLTSSTYMDFDPSQVRKMFGGKAPEKSTVQKGRTTIYRMVRPNNWNVLMLVKSDTWTPVQGNTYQLRLEGFDNTEVSAVLESYTQAGGELLLRLSVRSDVTPVLYMRTCQAEIGEKVNSMKVPNRAIYRHSNGMDGVVVVNADGSQVFVAANVITTDGEYTYIDPIQQGLLYVGQTVRLF
ncbi:MAG: hypothetical protein IJF65_01360 [Clostridia bacterium]|nr:hypothetical protein [Clostridia bacterium]